MVCISADYAVEFVSQLYRIFLNRKPDETGFQHYLSRLHDGALPHEIVESFLQSQEFQALWQQKNLSPPEPDEQSQRAPSAGDEPI